MFVEPGDVVEVPRDLPHLQLGVHVMISFRKARLILVVEASPKKTRIGSVLKALEKEGKPTSKKVIRLAKT